MADPRRYMQIRADLERRIASGELAPGTPLNIGRLADEHDVGRDTVQQAIRLLADAGLVERWPGLGWFVADPTSRAGA